MLVALTLAALGAVAIAGAMLALRSLGPRYRIGRLLSATPVATIDEAVALAAGRPAYVRLSGRISSEEEFPDEHDRPLVFRRTRIEIAGAAGAQSILDEREAVPFGIESRSSFIAVDYAAVGDGLVAIPREAAGRADELPPDLRAALPAGTDPATPARLVIEQLSAVEHATVCGRPVLRDGQPMLTAGTGRPLIVTTLESAAAMRVLAAGHRARVIGAAIALLGGLALVAAAVVGALLGV